MANDGDFAQRNYMSFWHLFSYRAVSHPVLYLKTELSQKTPTVIYVGSERCLGKVYD
jgi:hypothetical protein